MRHLLLAILLIPFLALSGDENYSIGGRATGMGNTCLIQLFFSNSMSFFIAMSFP
jgi:hypothetical protein